MQKRGVNSFQSGLGERLTDDVKLPQILNHRDQKGFGFGFFFSVCVCKYSFKNRIIPI